MTAEDKQRIEKEALSTADGWDRRLTSSHSGFIAGYIAGATRENERIAELLKEERNKAIDECKRVIQSMHDISLNANYQFVYSLAIENLEKLKSQ